MRFGKVVAIAAWAGLLAVASEAGAPGFDAGTPALGANMIAPGPDSFMVRLARDGAARRLASPACAQIFSDFVDGSGRPLQEQLDAYNLSGPEYLALVYFAPGAEDGRCGNEAVLATTHPGSRLVKVCGRFGQAYRKDPRWAEFVVIHETLHTLGLGEDPPSTYEISARVAARCR